MRVHSGYTKQIRDSMMQHKTPGLWIIAAYMKRLKICTRIVEYIKSIDQWNVNKILLFNFAVSTKASS